LDKTLLYNFGSHEHFLTESSKKMVLQRRTLG